MFDLVQLRRRTFGLANALKITFSIGDVLSSTF